MKIKSVASHSVLVAPQTVEEAGAMQWLAARFQGKAVKLTFDTTQVEGCDYHPMLWVCPILESQPDTVKLTKGEE